MNQHETDKIFNTITSNGCREMDEVRFNQAINEILHIHYQKIDKILQEIVNELKSWCNNEKSQRL